MASPDVGSGSVISFGTYITNNKVVDFSLDPIERPIVDVTTYSMSGGREFIIGKLYEAELSMTVLLDTAGAPQIPITHTSATACTITFPTSTHSMGFSAWLYRAVVNPPIEDRITATLSLKVTGDITATWLL